MPEPLDLLSRLADDVGPAGLPPEEVRRRGDRLRRRRTALQAVGAVAVLAVVAGLGSTLADGSHRATGPEPAPATQAPTTTHGIPLGFPIDQGFPDPGRDGTLVGPGDGDDAALSPVEACGTRAYPVEQPVQRLSVRYQAPEDFRARELTVYRGDVASTLVVRGFGRAMRDCPREETGGTTALTTLTRATGGDETWAAVTTYEQGGRAALGLQVTTATRVGPYVLVATRSDEGSKADAARQLDEQLTEVRSLVRALGFDDYVLTHSGYGALRLGMTAPEVAATGQADVQDGQGCRGVTLSAAAPAKDEVDGFVSAKHGLVAIFARPGVRTEEGISTGDTRREVAEAYGGGMDDESFVSYPVDEQTSYVFGFARDRVESIALQRDDQDCYQ